jgi:hypothetical protein
MNLALRPYVTTGVAIVGASVIAVAPIVPTPTEIQVPNPAVQVDRAVQLTANEIEDAVNALAFAGAEVLVTLAKLPAPVVAQFLGVPTPVAELLLASSALGLSGPLISGTGAAGAAIQDVVDELGSGDLAALIDALIGAPTTLFNGVVHGGSGPNVGPLLGFPEILPVLTGGLLNPGNLNPLNGALIVPGTIPTLQLLITLLTSALGAGDMVSALAVPIEGENQIEGAVNFLLFNLVASPIVTVAGLLGSALAPVLGEEEAALLTLVALGLLGPLISGPGAVGSALQDVVDALGSGDFAGVLNALLGAPATITEGVLHGGAGPSLTPLVGDLLFPLVPPQSRPTVLAGGLVNGPDLIPPIVLPGTLPTLQRLVGQIVGLATAGPAALPGLSNLQELIDQVLGLVPSVPEALVTESPSVLANVTSTTTTNQRLVSVDLPKDDVTPDLGGDVRGNSTAALDAKPAIDPAGVVGTTSAGSDLETAVAPRNGATDMTDGSKFEPEVITPTGGDSRKGSNPIGATLSGVAKNFGNAVKSALGGGSSNDGGEG